MVRRRGREHWAHITIVCGRSHLLPPLPPLPGIPGHMYLCLLLHGALPGICQDHWATGRKNQHKFPTNVSDYLLVAPAHCEFNPLALLRRRQPWLFVRPLLDDVRHELTSWIQVYERGTLDFLCGLEPGNGGHGPDNRAHSTHGPIVYVRFRRCCDFFVGQFCL